MPPSPEGRPLSALAEQVGGTVVGDGSVRIRGVAPIADAEPDQITFLANSRYREALTRSSAGAVIIARADASLPMAQLVVDDPYYAYATLLAFLCDRPRLARGISDDARVRAERVGTEPDIAAFVTVGEGTVLGDRVTLHPGVQIGEGCEIGDDVELFPNVVVRDHCRLGNRVRVHSGTVIGSDGFGYATHKGVHHKIPHVGRVIIEDDVELGANVTVDRGVMGDTRIGAGTKIDNLVQLAHNVQLGKGCLMASQSGVSGSSRLGDYVVLGGQVGVAGHLTVGDQVMVGGKGGVTKSLPGGQMYSGFPAAPHREYLKGQAAAARVPRMKEQIRQLQAQVDALLKKLDGNPRNG